MKKLSKCSTEQALAIVLNSKHLSQLFENRILEEEFDYLSDKIHCFPRGSVDYSYGVCSPSWMTVNHPSDFMIGVVRSIQSFGGSERLKKLVEYTERLEGTNLYEHYVEKVCSLYFKEEFLSTIEWLEDIGMRIYNKDDKDPELLEQLSNKIDCDMFDDVYVNGSGESVRMDRL